MNNLSRKKDLFFGSIDSEVILKIEDFPALSHCVDDQLMIEDVSENFVIDIYKDNGLIQLRNLISLDFLYSESHASGTQGEVWKNHHKSFASFIASNKTPSNVFEIGGLHGILSTHFNEVYNQWTIIDPSPNPTKNCRANFIQGYFNEDLSLDFSKYDTFIHSHVLEHLYEPLKFIETLATKMHAGSDLFFAVPNIKSMIKNKYSNALNFEHTYFFDHDLILNCFQSYGFDFLGSKSYLGDHSDFFWFRRSSRELKPLQKYNKYIENKAMIENWVISLKKDVELINQKLNGDHFFIFGAHIFSQILMGLGLNTDSLICILDNSATKHQKRLYGTSFIVNSPQVLKQYKSPKVVLRAGAYSEEIKISILKTNPNSIII